MTTGSITLEDVHARTPAPADDWDDPVDFFTNALTYPQLRPDCLPQVLSPFVFDVAERLGIDPSAVALSALVSLASVMSDDWRIQPKRHDGPRAGFRTSGAKRST